MCRFGWGNAGNLLALLLVMATVSLPTSAIHLTEMPGSSHMRGRVLHAAGGDVAGDCKASGPETVHVVMPVSEWLQQVRKVGSSAKDASNSGAWVSELDHLLACVEQHAHSVAGQGATKGASGVAQNRRVQAATASGGQLLAQEAKALSMRTTSGSAINTTAAAQLLWRHKQAQREAQLQGGMTPPEVQPLVASIMSALRASKRPGDLRFHLLVPSVAMAPGLCKTLLDGLSAADKNPCVGDPQPSRLCPSNTRAGAFPAAKASAGSIGVDDVPECTEAFVAKASKAKTGAPVCSCGPAQLSLVLLDRASDKVHNILAKLTDASLHKPQKYNHDYDPVMLRGALHELLLPLGLTHAIYLDANVVVQHDLWDLWSIAINLPLDRSVAMARCRLPPVAVPVPGAAELKKAKAGKQQADSPPGAAHWLHWHDPAAAWHLTQRPDVRDLGCLPDEGVMAINVERYGDMNLVSEFKRLMRLNTSWSPSHHHHTPHSALQMHNNPTAPSGAAFLLSVLKGLELIDEKWSSNQLGGPSGLLVPTSELDAAHVLHWTGACKPWLPQPFGHHFERWQRYLGCGAEAGDKSGPTHRRMLL